MIDYLSILKDKCKDFYLYVAPVLEDPRFSTWSGAGSDIHHHYGNGGLLLHTYEVYRYAELIACEHNSTCRYLDSRINPQELFISVIWHDYGKIWDYQKIDGVWGKHDNHARKIHHISRSAIEWEKYYPEVVTAGTITSCPINGNKVTHNILAHHGRREWGSPVAPESREAWVLHLADNLSARLNDCDKHDILKH